MRSAVQQVLDYNHGFDRASLARKLARILESPFSFYRGTFHLFAADMLEGLFRDWPHTTPAGAIVGDLHTENFGTFRAVSGDIVYDINDFDETTTAPYDYDLRRLTCSIALAAFDNRQTLAQVVHAVELCVRGYLDTVTALAASKTRAEFEALRARKEIRSVLADAKEKSRVDMMKALAAETPGSRFVFRASDRLAPLDAATRDAITRAVPQFLKSLGEEHHAERFTFQDAVFRFAGCGSLGRQRYALLFGKGQTPQESLDTLRLIEWKDALDSSLDSRQPRASANRAKQVVANTEGFQIDAKRYLGYVTLNGRPMQSREIGANDARFAHKLFHAPERFARAAQIFGEITARAHLVSSLGAEGPRGLLKELRGKEDRWVARMVAFALAYAHVAHDDFDEFIARRAEVAKAWGVKTAGAG